MSRRASNRRGPSQGRPRDDIPAPAASGGAETREREERAREEAKALMALPLTDDERAARGKALRAGRG